MKRFKNWLGLIGGMFYPVPLCANKNAVEFYLSRFLWEIPQNGIGFILASCVIFSGNYIDIRIVKETIVLRLPFRFSAFTVGCIIIADKYFTPKFKDPVMKHEYGHYLQSKIYGPFYLLIVGASGLFSAFLKPSSHRKRWFEREADSMVV
jgi:hypothetical protein